MRCFLYAIPLLLSMGTLSAQRDKEPLYSNPRYKLRAALLDQSVFSLPAVRIYGDYLLLDSELPDYLTAELGINYYSVDEDVPSVGYTAGLRLSSTRFANGTRSAGISPGIQFQHVFIHDYLRVEKQVPGLGTYSAYEKKQFSKQRLAFSVDFYRQYRLFGPLFFETSLGLGIIYMNTIVPEDVRQETYTNGLSVRRESLLPNLCFSMKIGYAFYR